MRIREHQRIQEIIQKLQLLQPMTSEEVLEWNELANLDIEKQNIDDVTKKGMVYRYEYLKSKKEAQPLTDIENKIFDKAIAYEKAEIKALEDGNEELASANSIKFDKWLISVANYEKAIEKYEKTGPNQIPKVVFNEDGSLNEEETSKLALSGINLPAISSVYAQSNTVVPISPADMALGENPLNTILSNTDNYLRQLSTVAIQQQQQTGYLIHNPNQAALTDQPGYNYYAGTIVSVLSGTNVSLYISTQLVPVGTAITNVNYWRPASFVYSLPPNFTSIPINGTQNSPSLIGTYSNVDTPTHFKAQFLYPVGSSLSSISRCIGSMLEIFIKISNLPPVSSSPSNSNFYCVGSVENLQGNTDIPRIYIGRYYVFNPSVIGISAFSSNQSGTSLSGIISNIYTQFLILP